MRDMFKNKSILTIIKQMNTISSCFEDLDCFQYFLIPKPRSSASNMPKDNLEHLLSLKKTKPKNKPTPPRIN